MLSSRTACSTRKPDHSRHVEPAVGNHARLVVIFADPAERPVPQRQDSQIPFPRTYRKRFEIQQPYRARAVTKCIALMRIAMDHARRKDEFQFSELLLEKFAAAPEELHVLSVHGRSQASPRVCKRLESRQCKCMWLCQPVQVTKQPGDIDHMDRFRAFLDQFPERNGTLAENQRLADVLGNTRGREAATREPPGDVELLADILKVTRGDSDHNRMGRQPIVGVRAQPQ